MDCGKFENGAITAAMGHWFNAEGKGEEKKLGKINLFSKKDIIPHGSARDRPDDPTVLDVWGHGTESFMNGLSADGTYFDANGNPIRLSAIDMADLIRNSGEWSPGDPIRLRACNVGNRDRAAIPLAQDLSKSLDTTVIAPNWYYRPNVVDGWSVTAKYWPFASFGGWNHFDSGEYVKTTEQ